MTTASTNSDDTMISAAAIWTAHVMVECAKIAGVEADPKYISIIANVSPEDLMKVRKNRGRIVNRSSGSSNKSNNSVNSFDSSKANLAEGLPAPGTLTAHQFLVAIRSAGLRFKQNEQGATVPYRAEYAIQRQDEKAAIAGFIGWNANENHGTQLDLGRSRAEYYIRTMKSGKRNDNDILAKIADMFPAGVYSGSIAPYRRTAEHTVKGYVSGIPDSTRKTIIDLIKRMDLELAMMCSWEQTARDICARSEVNSQGEIFEGLLTLDTPEDAPNRKNLYNILFPGNEREHKKLEGALALVVIKRTLIEQIRAQLREEYGVNL